MGASLAAPSRSAGARLRAAAATALVGVGALVSRATAATAFAGAAALLSLSCDGARASNGGAHAAAHGGFLKGQLHAHSWGSMDSDAPPNTVVRWYSQRGYDFLVLTDHNRLTRAAGTPSMLVLPGVELTLNLRTCEPPPPPEKHCLLHVNALVPERPLSRDPWLPEMLLPSEGRFVVEEGFRREDLFGAELDEAARMGAVAQINHPNFHFAADADALVKLAGRGLALIEIANQSHDAQNDGDGGHVSTEALWDRALTRGARLFGTATDDAHDYFGDDVPPAARPPEADTGDRGWVMVRADRTARSIREALARGDFYATTGVLFERLEMSPKRVSVAVEGEEPVWLEAIGDSGGVYRAEIGRAMTFDPRALGSSYVRLRVTDAKGRHAWTQPVFTPRSP